MNRIIEIVAMAVGGLSLFVVAFVGFASLSGRDVRNVAVIGKLFPAPAEEHAVEGAVEGEPAPEDEEHAEGLSDAAVIEASLGVLSAWTLPSPYSTSELRVLSEEIKKKHAELLEREHALGRRERAVEQDEQELEERLKTLEELRTHIEGLQQELSERELALAAGEGAAQASKDAAWAEVARVFETIEDPLQAARKLQEYEPEEAAKILRALGDDARAGEILNAVAPARWKEFVAAYTAEKTRTAGKAASKKQ
jgi:flagellar motility protein MotE (MotC chaperone)